MDQVADEQQLQFLRQVIDLNPNLISVQDREGRFVLVNQALLDFYGTTVEELLGRTVEDLTDPEQAARLRGVDQAVLDSRQEQVLPDYPVVDAQGNQRWLQTVKRPLLDTNGLVRYILGVSTDVTERHRAEEKITQERNLLRTLINTLPDYIHIKDAEGHFLVANTAVAHLMGAESAEDLIGKTDFDFYPPEVAAEYHADEQAIIESGQPLLDKDEPHRDSEGNWTWTLTTKIPVRDEEGQVIALVGVSRDVTERRRLHQRLQESLARRTQEVLTATEIAQEIAAVPALDELYHRVVTLVKERFGYYHVQIFQHDAKRNVMALVAGYGEVGARMKAAGYNLPYGRGVAGTAAASGKPVLVADVTQDPKWEPHPDLPETKGELAVPIKLRNEVLGVLDVQSDRPHALSAEDQVMLLGLAGQIAGAIESTRALEQANTFRQFVQASAQGFGMATLDAQIVYVNPALARLLGEERPEDAVGKPLTHYYPPEIQRWIQTDVLPTIMQTGQWNGKLTITPRSGQPIPALASFFLIRDEQGKPLYLASALTDITRQEQAEAQLNTRIRILDCLSDIGRMIDESPPLEEFWPRLAERLAQGFQYPDLCRVAIEFEGQVYGAAEAAESPYQMVSTLQIGGERVGKIRIAYTQDRPFLNEESALLGDISRRVSVFVENRRLFQQTQQALAEMARSQAELEQATALQQTILNSADYAIIATTLEGTIITFNPAAERMLGYQDNEVINQASLTILHDPAELAERARLFSEELGIPIEPGFEVLAARARQNLPNRYEWTCIRKDGSRFPIQLSVTALRDAQDQITGFLGIAQDISEQRRAELEREETLQEMERLYRAMSREGWEILQREIAGGYRYDQVSLTPAQITLPEVERALAEQTFVPPDPKSGRAAVAPLAVRGTTIGALGVQDNPENPLLDEDLALIEAIAEQTALALESTRLFTQTQVTLAETEALYQAGRLINAAQSEEEVLDAMLGYANRLDLDRCLIALLEDPSAPPAERQVVVRAVWDRAGQEEQFLGTRFTVDHIPAIALLQSDTFLIIPDMATSNAVDEQSRATFRRLGVTAAAITPLSVGNQLLGWLLAETIGRTRAFTSRETEALQSLTSQAAVAIQSKRHLEEARIRAEELTILNTLGQALTTRLDTAAIIETLYEHTSRLMDLTSFYVALYDEQTDRVSFPLYIERGKRRQVPSRQGGQGLTEHVIHTAQPLLLTDNIIQRSHELNVQPVGEEAASWLGVPMLLGKRVLGMLAVQSYETSRLYGAHHRDLLMSVASQAAIALENRRLFEEAQARAHREQILREIVSAISVSEDLVESLPTIHDHLRQLLPVDVLTLATYTPGEEEYTIFALRVESGADHFAQQSTRLPVAGTGPGWVLSHGEPWLEGDIRIQSPFAEDEQLIAEGVISRLLLPLQAGGHVIGTLNLGSTQPDAFHEDDLSILSQIADQMALALERARLLEETRAALAEVEAVHRSYLRKSWQEHLHQQEMLTRSGFLYDQRQARREAGPIIIAPDLRRPEMEKAVLDNAPAVAPTQDAEARTGLAAPIRVRGQTIGVLGVESPGGERQWTEDDLALIAAVGEQLGQTLEGARLFADAQRRAEQERLIGEITARIRASTDIQDIVATTATELGRALGADRALVRVGLTGPSSPEEEPVAESDLVGD